MVKRRVGVEAAIVTGHTVHREVLEAVPGTLQSPSTSSDGAVVAVPGHLDLIDPKICVAPFPATTAAQTSGRGSVAAGPVGVYHWCREAGNGPDAQVDSDH